LKTEAVKTKLEEELVSRLRSQDPGAMAVLYDNYSKALFGVILRILRNQQIAEDVLQESFLKIWVSIDTYDEEKGRFFTWILNIARNQAIDKLRSKEYKKDFRTDSIECGGKTFVGDNTTSDKADQIGLKELTQKLKPEQKILVDMLYFEGYTQSEVAEELNIPLGTIKTRIRAALKVLSSILIK
jgi:RNA polymerase sigma factor (sigma-70 family)